MCCRRNGTKTRSICQTGRYSPKDCILATNTSVMSPTEIAAKVKYMKGLYISEPAHLIPLVEVVKTDYTSDEVVNVTMAILEKVGNQFFCKKMFQALLLMDAICPMA